MHACDSTVREGLVVQEALQDGLKTVSLSGAAVRGAAGGGGGGDARHHGRGRRRQCEGADSLPSSYDAWSALPSYFQVVASSISLVLTSVIAFSMMAAHLLD